MFQDVHKSVHRQGIKWLFPIVERDLLEFMTTSGFEICPRRMGPTTGNVQPPRWTRATRVCHVSNISAGQGWPSVAGAVPVIAQCYGVEFTRFVSSRLLVIPEQANQDSLKSIHLRVIIFLFYL